MLFDYKIALFNQDCTNKEETIKLLSSEFIKRGVVKESYTEGLLNREKSFPTGLKEEGMIYGVAIPHTFAEHVNIKQIGFMSLKNPIKWNYMGDVSQTVDVNFVFMLALKEGHDQLDMLVSLMKLFANNDLMEKLKNVNEFEDLLTIIKEANINID